MSQRMQIAKAYEKALFADAHVYEELRKRRPELPKFAQPQG